MSQTGVKSISECLPDEEDDGGGKGGVTSVAPTPDKSKDLSVVTLATVPSVAADELQIVHNRLFARVSCFGDVLIGVVDMVICGILLKDLVEMRTDKFSTPSQGFKSVFILFVVGLAAMCFIQLFFTWRLWKGTTKYVPLRKALRYSLHWRNYSGGLLVVEVSNGICYCSMGSPPLTHSLEIPLFSCLLLRVALVIFVHQFVEELRSFLETREGLGKKSVGVEVSIGEEDDSRSGSKMSVASISSSSDRISRFVSVE